MEHPVTGKPLIRGLPVRAFLLLLMTAASAPAQIEGDTVPGRVVFVEGEPRLYRNGRELLEPVDFGTPLENYDLLTTAPEAFLEMAVSTGASSRDRITLQGDSAGVILRRPGVIVFRLLYGSVQVDGAARSTDGPDADRAAAQAAEPAGNPEPLPLLLELPGSNAEVRGGRFTVDRSFTGAVFVTSTEGPAELRLPDGQRQFADRGRAVLLSATGELRSRRIPSEGIDAARRRWRFDGIREFQRAPELHLEEAFRRYFARREAFARAYAELMGLRDIFDLWIENDRTERQASRTVLETQLQRVEPALAETLHSMRDFAAAYYALRDSESYLPVRGLDAERLYLLEGRSLRTLYDELAADAGVYERQMHVLRYLAKLQAERRQRL